MPRVRPEPIATPPSLYESAVKALKSAQEAVAARDYRLALNYALDSRDRAQTAAKEAATQQVTPCAAAPSGFSPKWPR